MESHGVTKLVIRAMVFEEYKAIQHHLSCSRPFWTQNFPFRQVWTLEVVQRFIFSIAVLFQDTYIINSY